MAKMKAAKKSAKRAGGGRRPAGEDLASYITSVLGGSKSAMGIADVASAVKKSGYSSSSPAFTRIVAIRLSTDKRFKRVERGMYTLAKGKK
ncbi:MAG: hypothetical protein ACKVS6_02725 [Planctomycetota bacterium]